MPHQCTSCGRTFADGSKEMLSGCPDCGGNKFQFMPAGAVDGDAGDAGGRGRASAATAPKKQPDDAPPSNAGAPETGSDRLAGDNRATGDRSGAAGDRSAVDRAASTVRQWVSSRSDGDESTNRSDAAAERSDAPATRTDTPTERPDGTPERPANSTDRPGRRPASPPEDSAQASARSDVVSESELPDDPPATAPSAGDTGARTPRDSSTDESAPGNRPSQDDSSTRDDLPPRSESSTRNDAPASGGADAARDQDNVVDAPDDDDPGLEALREELNNQFESIRIVNPGQYELNLMELYEREEYIISLQEDGKYVIEVPDAWDATER